MGFFDGSDGEESTCNAGDAGLIPGLGRPLEKGMATHSTILAHSDGCLFTLLICSIEKKCIDAEREAPSQ